MHELVQLLSAVYTVSQLWSLRCASGLTLQSYSAFFCLPFNSRTLINLPSCWFALLSSSCGAPTSLSSTNRASWCRSSARCS